jgi:ABC-type transporter Mla maintaining outer membrane lipid asymmetry ATPase subunit MlaF
MAAPSEHSEAPVLELKQAQVASLESPDLIVLRDVNWTVHKKDYWVVGGPPGSGKSDFFATAAGLVRPLTGTHRLFGVDTFHLREEERVRMQLRVGMVFGFGGRLFNHLTVAENVALPLCYHQNRPISADEPRVQSVLAALELQAVSHLRPVDIDRNLRQRTALARALVLSPELLVLDNAVAGTGPRELRWWLGFLDSLIRGHPVLDGRIPTVIVGTTDLEHWGGHGRQFALTHDGHFRSFGNRADLLAQVDSSSRELLPLAWLRG